MSDDIRQVTTAYPIDVTDIRDAGMRALVILAASLGWNVTKKHNQPVVITARDGFQKRLPTSTSVRMSVYQTALSSIILYSTDAKATPELIDTITKETKLDHDHARRMRLAIAEPDVVHADRVVNAENNPKENGEWERAINDLVPTDVIDRRPDDQDWADWNQQLNNLPHVLKADRRGISTLITFTTADREPIWWCSFPGCRVHGENLYAVRGHSRVHTARWGTLSDQPEAIRRSASVRAVREKVKAAAMAEPVVLPPLPDPDVEPTYSPVDSSDNLVDRYTTDALALLEIANRFVADLDMVTDLLSRIGVDADELEQLREKAAKYDRMMEVLGGNA